MSALRLKEFASGWRAVCLVAITYVYFLIFAQFAFLNRLGQLGIADAHLQIVMAAMAFGGIIFSLVSSLQAFEARPRLRLQFALLLCAAAAAFTLLPLDLVGSIAIAFLIGSGLGLLTVTLVSNLQLWLGSGDGLMKVGLGTGLGYFLCNVPALFTATPNVQALTAASLCIAGVLAAWKSQSSSAPEPVRLPWKCPSFAAVLISFTALVWLDSAAFFIIQSTPALKAGTWQGTLHLWSNGTLHFAAAVFSAYLLRRRSLTTVLGLAVLCLAIACLLLHQPGHAVLASLLYPVGVSLYSVALVAYPSLLSGRRSPHLKTLKAGLIYAIAGWFGSAMGIGMGQHLRQVPVLFIFFAASLILGPTTFKLFRNHRRETGLVAAGSFVALCLHFSLRASAPSATTLTAAERGRQVYIAEGCINCHSQYVRPNTNDALPWGPAETIDELRSQRPPLIGNRRQGPDLSQVGGRRSPLWLKAHFINPAEVSRASFMPSYAHLFSNSSRGDDLVQYLASLKSSNYTQHIALEQTWQPSNSAANPDKGPHLYALHCATCHEPTGPTRLAWAVNFKRLPPDLQNGPLIHVHGPSPDRAVQIARIIKFGIPATDMPGHEYLSDHDVASIALWLNRSIAQPNQLATIHPHSGENQ